MTKKQHPLRRPEIKEVYKGFEIIIRLGILVNMCLKRELEFWCLNYSFFWTWSVFFGCFQTFVLTLSLQETSSSKTICISKFVPPKRDDEGRTLGIHGR